MRKKLFPESGIDRKSQQDNENTKCEPCQGYCQRDPLDRGEEDDKACEGDRLNESRVCPLKIDRIKFPESDEGNRGDEQKKGGWREKPDKNKKKRDKEEGWIDSLEVKTSGSLQVWLHSGIWEVRTQGILVHD